MKLVVYVLFEHDLGKKKEYHALKHCSKLEKIITLECDHISPKPKVKKMNTLEKVQDYLKRL